jgi:hypothetical protein
LGFVAELKEWMTETASGIGEAALVGPPLALPWRRMTADSLSLSFVPFPAFYPSGPFFFSVFLPIDIPFPVLRLFLMNPMKFEHDKGD